jgi:hypothetical protein
MDDALDPRSGEHAQPKIGSERSFGIMFAVVFAIIGLWPLVRGGSVRLWPLAAATVFLGAAIMAPRALLPFNRLWFRLGMVLSKVMTPLVMGVLFVVAVMPVGFLMRLFGKDPLRLRREPRAESYWIERSPPGPTAESLKDQF